MKSKLTSGILALSLMLFFSINLFAQEYEEENTSPFSIGADVVSSYVWRGTKIGTGPNIQPSVSFSKGGFTLGSWGSFSLHEFGDFAETDLFLLYEFDFGLSLGVSDYYYQGFPYFSYSGDTASHAFEGNLGYSVGNFSIAANYIFNDASMGGPANKQGGGDMYFEASYSLKNVDLILGAGNGWHTSDENGEDVFAICNIGMKTTKEIKVSETFSIPVTGALILNPHEEQMNLVVGFSF